MSGPDTQFPLFERLFGRPLPGHRNAPLARPDDGRPSLSDSKRAFIVC
jgi:hypothetical protein